MRISDWSSDVCSSDLIYSDKVLVKDFVAQRIGKDHVISTLWCGKQLPPIRDRNWPKPFVIKANHGSGSNIFVTEKDKQDWPAIEKEASSWMRQRYRPHLHERHYDKIDSQLLIETSTDEHTYEL